MGAGWRIEAARAEFAYGIRCTGQDFLELSGAAYIPPPTVALQALMDEAPSVR